MAADTVHHVLKDLIGPRAAAKPNDCPANLVGIDPGGYNDADLIAPIVVHQKRATVVQPLEVDRARFMGKDFLTKPPHYRCGRRKRELNCARLFVNVDNLGHPLQALSAATLPSVDLLRCQRAGQGFPDQVTRLAHCCFLRLQWFHRGRFRLLGHLGTLLLISR